MAVTIDASDARSIRAVELAAGASAWLKCWLADGCKAYGIRSSRDPSRFYLTNCESCTCYDFRRHQQHCKHVLAVRLHVELVRAGVVKAQAAPRRPEKRPSHDRRWNASTEPKSRTSVLGSRWDALGQLDG